jgi:GNAT superfamily N-acetyltransferase
MVGILEAADRNMVDLWQKVAASGPRPGAVTDGGLLLLSSGIPIPLFNPAFVVGPVDDPAGAVERAVAHYREVGLPCAVYFRDEVAPGLATACQAAGMVEHWRPPLMVLDPVPAVTPPLPDGVTIEPVDEATLGTYVSVLCGGFGIPDELLAPVFGPGLVSTVGLTLFLALLDGEPAATSAAYVDDVAGVYNVATLPAARGRGVGAAITWAAAVAGRDAGVTRSILQASEMGEPVYRRMGYETPTRYRQFEPAPTR